MESQSEHDAAGAGRGRLLRVVSRCTNVDEFVAAFRRFCDHASIFVITTAPKAMGTRQHFTITLSDGTPMLRGEGEVVESAPESHPRFQRPGMRIRFVDLTEESRAVLDRIVPPGPAAPTRATPPPIPVAARERPAQRTLLGIAPTVITPLTEGAPEGTDAGQPKPTIEIAPAMPRTGARKRSQSPPATTDDGWTDAAPAEGGSDGKVVVAADGPDETTAVDRKAGGRAPTPPPVPAPEAAAPEGAPSPGAPRAREADEAMERRTTGSYYVVPANPFGEVTDQQLEAFVECTLYEEAFVPRVPDDVASGEIAAATMGSGEPVAATEPSAWAAPVATGWEPPSTAAPSLAPMAAVASASGPMAMQASGPMAMPSAPMAGQVSGPMPMVPVPSAPEPRVEGDLLTVFEARALRRGAAVRAAVLAAVVASAASLAIGYVLWGERGGTSQPAVAATGTGTPTPAPAAAVARTADPSPTAASPAASPSAPTPAPAAVARTADPAARTPTPADPAARTPAPAETAARAPAEPARPPSAAARPPAPAAIARTAAPPAPPPAPASPPEAAARTPAAPPATGPRPPDDCEVAVSATAHEVHITIDGTAVGTAPLRAPVPCGSATIAASHPRYERASQSVAVAPGAPAQVEFVMRRPKHKLNVTSAPVGAIVEIEGRTVGRTPVSIEIAGFTFYDIKVQRAGYEPARRRIYSRHNGTIVNLTLTSVKPPAPPRPAAPGRSRAGTLQPSSPG